MSITIGWIITQNGFSIVCFEVAAAGSEVVVAIEVCKKPICRCGRGGYMGKVMVFLRTGYFGIPAE